MKFYVNKNEQWTGEHEVHRADCAWLPDAAAGRFSLEAKR